MRGIERLVAVERSTPAMARALPELPMPETVMVRLLRINVVGLGQFFEPVFRDIGLTESSFHVLCLLMAADQGRAAPSELSELVGTSRANMTRILGVLTADGLVTREGEERDGRRATIQITPLGRSVAHDAVPRLRAPLELAFADLSAEEFDLLNALLRKLIKSFDKSPLPLHAGGRAA